MLHNNGGCEKYRHHAFLDQFYVDVRLCERSVLKQAEANSDGLIIFCLDLKQIDLMKMICDLKQLVELLTI
jgi:hypothetical protein